MAPPKFKACPWCAQLFGSASWSIHEQRCHSRPARVAKSKPAIHDIDVEVCQDNSNTVCQDEETPTELVTSPCRCVACIRYAYATCTRSKLNWSLHIRVCGRCFVRDRLEKHESVCFKTGSQGERPVFDSKAQRKSPGKAGQSSKCVPQEGEPEESGCWGVGSAQSTSHTHTDHAAEGAQPQQHGKQRVEDGGGGQTRKQGKSSNTKTRMTAEQQHYADFADSSKQQQPSQSQQAQQRLLAANTPTGEQGVDTSVLAHHMLSPLRSTRIQAAHAAAQSSTQHSSSQHSSSQAHLSSQSKPQRWAPPTAAPTAPSTALATRSNRQSSSLPTNHLPAHLSTQMSNPNTAHSPTPNFSPQQHHQHHSQFSQSQFGTSSPHHHHSPHRSPNLRQHLGISHSAKPFVSASDLKLSRPPMFVTPASSKCGTSSSPHGEIGGTVIAASRQPVPSTSYMQQHQPFVDRFSASSRSGYY